MAPALLSRAGARGDEATEREDLAGAFPTTFGGAGDAVTEAEAQAAPAATEALRFLQIPRRKRRLSRKL